MVLHLISVYFASRGGGEYGEEWHAGGTLSRKQKVFDDFVAAAKYLLEEDYTRKDQLAIMGGSNGGLVRARSLWCLRAPRRSGDCVS